MQPMQGPPRLYGGSDPNKSMELPHQWPQKYTSMESDFVDTQPLFAHQPDLGAARYIQDFSIPSAESNIESMSHAHTTVDSKRGEQRNNKEGGSVYSYNSTRDLGQFVRETYGRIFNTLSDTYLLPTDDAEWVRLDKQHSLLLIACDGLYPCHDIVEAVLAPVQGETKRILDLGCGTGSWAIEMAMQFPHCEVRGVDLAPTPLDSSTFPPNLSFEIDDINSGLVHFYDQFDLVHARCLMTGIKDAEKTIREMQLCLKPGGVLLIVNGDKNLYDEHRKKQKMAKLEGDEDVDSVSGTGSWLQRKMWEAHEAAKMAASNHEQAGHIVDLGLGLWDGDLCDPDTVVSGSIYIPVGPWASSPDLAENQALSYVGMLMRQVFLSIHRGYHPMLLRYGITQQTLDEWTALVDDELNTMRLHMWLRYRFCWARRRAGEGLPAPPLPSITPNSTMISSPDASVPLINMPAVHSRRQYSAIEFFHSREEAKAAWRRRCDDIGEWPTSAVRRATSENSLG